MAELHDLSESECRGLLAERQTGRVAVLAPDGPHIIPVNYALVDESVIFRTSPFTLLGTYARNTKMAFEIDLFDDASQTGWSVVARGRAAAVFDSQELDHIRKTWQPEPWADGVRNLYIRLTIAELSGRRVGARKPARSDAS